MKPPNSTSTDVPALAGHDTLGMAIAFLGVAIFSGTLPMTRLAVAELDAIWVACARAVLAAAIALIALLATRQPWPTRDQVRPLMITAAGVVLGFPLFTSLAMRTESAAHGAVVVGLLPFATALFAAWRNGERPAARFWWAAAVGCALVTGFAWRGAGPGALSGDLALVTAALCGGLGYAEGGRLARTLGGWQTIGWALVLSAPAMIVPTVWRTLVVPPSASAQAWLGFAYVSVLSQFVGFLFWYGGMAIGGVARVSQVQLLQLFLTLAVSQYLLHEPVPAGTWLVAIGVIATVVLARSAPIAPPSR
jgi:drug/metabolite transporter (DMT)-like permease